MTQKFFSVYKTRVPLSFQYLVILFTFVNKQLQS